MRTQPWIKDALKQRGFKLKDLAETLGLPPPRISDIVNGTREVQSDEVIPMAEMLGMSVRALLLSLAAGAPVPAQEGAHATLPIRGRLTGSGVLEPLPDDMALREVAVPLDATSPEGLSCYLMGDDSLAQEIRPGSLIIAADPRKHFFPMTPGVILLVSRPGGRIAARQYHRTANGEDWLVPLPEKPNPAYESWPFRLMPGARADSAGSDSVSTGDIVAGVLWVTRRYTD
ncbi:helix-turn-helix domain-containing protein [Pseudokordiimonas caeni]|uniref:helix-turn-helix domain-containing protein n=1 Tax=Pseudokordiimonas caeni TaxID=2997908 RepID=UPI00281212A6|nr:helix-turn-helix transcriptional regulator [Pseudokordiimonas caeni]